ncbi:hypothetical protein EJB05_04777, partial [Eragrostis curvula]
MGCGWTEAKTTKSSCQPSLAAALRRTQSTSEPCLVGDEFLLPRGVFDLRVTERKQSDPSRSCFWALGVKITRKGRSMMPKRAFDWLKGGLTAKQASGSGEGGLTAKQASGSREGGLTANYEGHLYLLLDDSAWGCSIHKICTSEVDNAFDLSSECNSDNDALVKSSELRLPRPFMRMEHHLGFREYTTAAFGTKIISLHPKILKGINDNLVTGGSMAILDVHSRELTFSPESKVNLFPPDLPIYFPLADKLFVLSYNSFQVLVNPVPDSTPTYGNLCYWRELPKPPFGRESVACYGVCPDKNFIFVSVSDNNSNEPATYTFNTAEMSSHWQLLGGWTLPFDGQVHFVSKLQVWVGLSLQSSGYKIVCSATLDDGAASFHSKEGLFSIEPWEDDVGTTLVCMAGTNNFCLAQFICCRHVGDPDEFHYLLRLVIFSLERDSNGKLMIGSSFRIASSLTYGSEGGEEQTDTPERTTPASHTLCK